MKYGYRNAKNKVLLYKQVKKHETKMFGECYKSYKIRMV
jgi:hypothetical protein